MCVPAVLCADVNWLQSVRTSSSTVYTANADAVTAAVCQDEHGNGKGEKEEKYIKNEGGTKKND